MYKTLLFLFIGILGFVILPVKAEETPKANPFTLTTSAFLDQGMLPVLYTCDGKDISPTLEWTNPPNKTETFALIFEDKDAPEGVFYHWVIYNIPKTETKLPEGIDKFPQGSVIAKNNFENAKYNGPCPPKGVSHTYLFSLYALDSKLTLPSTADAKTVLQAIQKHNLGEAKLTAVYSRWIQ